MNKLLPLSVQLTILSVLAYKYGAAPLEHPVACVFAGFAVIVIIRVMFKGR